MSTTEAITSMEAAINKKPFGFSRLETFANALDVIRPLQGQFSEDSYNDVIAEMNARKYNKNTVVTYVSAIKHLAKIAKLDIDFSEWKVKGEQTDNVYLTEDELIKLWRCNHLDGTTLKVTHCFLIMAFTGLRISDYDKVNDAVVEDGMYKIRTQKKGTFAYIPIHPIVTAILKMYDGQIPLYSRVTINKHIKIACQAAKISKYKEVKAHSGRRSAASNLRLKKVDMDTIKDILGHSDIKSTYGYTKCTMKEKVQLVKNVWK